jgi:hypothetical protein
LDQTTANQERELREIAGRMGCDIVHVYKDHGISGAKGRDKRPAFDRLCRDAAKRQFDMVMAWSVDRLGRSLQDLVGFLSELHALKIDLFLHQQGLDTTTPAGKAMFQMMGVFAEFERAMIQERVRAGLARLQCSERMGPVLDRQNVALLNRDVVLRDRGWRFGCLLLTRNFWPGRNRPGKGDYCYGGHCDQNNALAHLSSPYPR